VPRDVSSYFSKPLAGSEGKHYIYFQNMFYLQLHWSWQYILMFKLTHFPRAAQQISSYNFRRRHPPLMFVSEMFYIMGAKLSKLIYCPSVEK